MKSIIIEEDELSNIENIGKSLIFDENDPRSINYNREIERPKIYWGRAVLWCMALFFFFFLILFNIIKNNLLFFIISFLILILFLFLTIKKALICLIKIYQKIAPEEIRKRCRFEPSCSQYMILSIEKYGIVKGLSKGFSRLTRCNINGGGIDFP